MDSAKNLSDIKIARNSFRYNLGGAPSFSPFLTRELIGISRIYMCYIFAECIKNWASRGDQSHSFFFVNVLRTIIEEAHFCTSHKWRSILCTFDYLWCGESIKNWTSPRKLQLKILKQFPRNVLHFWKRYQSGSIWRKTRKISLEYLLIGFHPLQFRIFK